MKVCHFIQLCYRFYIDRLLGYCRQRDKSFEVKHMAVQCRTKRCDCALFATANATTLNLGGDPPITDYIQHNLKAHLAQ